VPDPSRFQKGDHSSEIPSGVKVVGVEDRVENLENEGYPRLGRCSAHVRDTVRARSLTERKALDGSLNLVRVG
jgi:hypothetical protein